MLGYIMAMIRASAIMIQRYIKRQCFACGEPITVKSKRFGKLLCDKHYRFYEMRAEARSKGKKVPLNFELESLYRLTKETCQCCGRKMNWLKKDGVDTVVTLQHNADGTMDLICQSCNTRIYHEGNQVKFIGLISPEKRKRSLVCTESKRRNRAWNSYK